jgi:four helix bundle protein
VEREGYGGYRDLKVFKLAYQPALEIHEATKRFPREERYALVGQIRRSSRSVAANLAEAWKKRRYEKLFMSKLIDSAGEAGETEVRLEFCKDLQYINEEHHGYFRAKYEEVNRMLTGMIDKAYKFSP